MPRVPFRVFVKSCLLIAFTACAVVLSGCSRPTGTLTGKVTFNSKTLKGGGVSFVSMDGLRSPPARIMEDGTYTVPNLQAGKYKVCVETESLKGTGTKKEIKIDPKMKNRDDIPVGGSNPAAANAARNNKNYVAIPLKYSSPDATDLTYEFKGGDQTWDIELK